MALPHLTTAGTTRKNIYEMAIVRGRNRENDFRENWKSNAAYFQKNNVVATKKKTWESESSFQNSMDAWKVECDKSEKVQRLTSRRKKLKEMLDEEQDDLQAELVYLKSDPLSRLDDMKYRSESLKSAREEKRQHHAADKLYEHWRMNSPDIRQLELDHHKQHVVTAWSGQVDVRRQQEEEERLEKEKIEAKMEADRLAALEVIREKEEMKLEEEKEMKRMLQQQMDELKKQEINSNKLKKDEDRLLKHQWEVDQLDEKRNILEKERKKMEFGRILLRQHAAALRRKSQQIQEELEQDKIFLEKLARQEEEEEVIQTSRQEKAKADATWMKQVVEEQLKVEKAREAELDMLYQDEAARIWQEREAEWAKERQARERLMKEVLQERQDQIQAHMDNIKQQQQESLEHREQLLEELDLVNQLTRRELEEKEEAKTFRKEELEAQMSVRRDRDMASALRINLDLEKEAKAELDYEEMLNKEAQQLSVRDYTPREHGRKKAWH